MKTTFKVALGVLAGVALTFILLEGWYYLQVLRWVDSIRIAEALKQAAAQAK